MGSIMGQLSAAVANLQAQILEESDRLARGAEEGLAAVGDLVLQESLKVVPVETKKLYDSGRADQNGSGFGTVVTVSFGGEASEYAVWVHDDLQAAHGANFNAKYAWQINSGRLQGTGWNKDGLRRPEEKAYFLQGPIDTNMEGLGRIAFEKALEAVT
jgi:hypothetical protein